MRKSTITALGAMAVAAMPLGAQTIYNARVDSAMHVRGRYQAPLCPLPGGDFRTSSAGLYLKTAVEGIQDENAGGSHSQVDNKKYLDIVKKAQTTAADALSNNPKSAAAWYYMGRADLQLGDLRGADSSFTQVVALSPDCAEEIKGLRQRAWIALVAPSSEFMRKMQSDSLSADQRQAWADSSLSVLRDAMRIARYYPQGFYNLGGTFADRQQYDSAIVYFKIALDKSGTDPQFAATRKQTTQNLAMLYQQTKDYPDAIQSWKDYLAIAPDDVNAKRSLGQLLEITGNKADASQIENQLMASGSMTPTELLGMGVRAFRDSNYAAAADAFQKVLAIQPGNHDALFDLASSYYWLKDGKSLVAASQKLLDVDPLSLSNVKLLANGYRLSGDQDKQIDVTTKLLAMTVDVHIDHFVPSATGAKLSGTVSGNAAIDAKGNPVQPMPMTLVFEFTDAQGAVVGSQEVAVPALQPNVKQDISAEVTAPGVVAWRYHPKT